MGVGVGVGGGGAFDPLASNLAPLGNVVLYRKGVTPPKISNFQLLPPLCKVSK